MLSSKAKSLQPVGGHSMLKRIYETVQDITDEATFVVGYEKESIIKDLYNYRAPDLRIEKASDAGLELRNYDGIELDVKHIEKSPKVHWLLLFRFFGTC